MKKRRFAYFLIFFVCLFYLLIPAVVFGQAIEVFKKYENTFEHPDVHAFLPPVLYAFNDPENQGFKNPALIGRVVEKPRYIRNFYEETHDSILILLLLDAQFGALFRDSQFHAMVQSPSEIDKLVGFINGLTPRERTDGSCEIPPPKATTLLIVSGYGQEGLAGTRLLFPFVVEVRDQYGEPFSGANVVFRVTGGSLSSTTALTNSFGQAQTTLTFGRSAGANSVEASVAGISPSQTFTATATASGEQRRATTLSIVSGDNQSGGSGMSLGQAFIVGVKDQSAKPLSGIKVTFRITAGRGQLSTQQVDTDSFGLARTTLTLGSSTGAIQVAASVTGISHSQTFTATATGAAEPIVSSQLPSVYWIEGGALYYRSTGGGKGVLLQPSSGSLTGGLAVDMEGDRIYWTEETGNNSGRIGSANLLGMDVKELAEVENGVPYGIAVGTDKSAKRWVYWTTSLGKVQRINVNGSGFKPNLMVGLNSPKHIAFDEREHKLYWTEPGRIRSVSANGEGKRVLVKGDLGELGGITVADGVVYWTEKTGNGQGKVRSVNSNRSGDKLLAVLEGIPSGIAVDVAGSKLYWTNSLGSIQSAPVAGGYPRCGHGLGVTRRSRLSTGVNGCRTECYRAFCN